MLELEFTGEFLGGLEFVFQLAGEFGFAFALKTQLGFQLQITGGRHVASWV
jgi:hypothetical protein